MRLIELPPMARPLLGAALSAAVLTATPALALSDTTPLRLAQPPAVSTVHVAHDFTPHTPKGDLLFPETALLATTEDGLLFPEPPRPELPLQRALREYGPYLPVIFLLWLASGAYFQWRFGVATPGGGGDRVAEARAAKRRADWLEASRIPGADDDAAAAPPPWSLVEAHDLFAARVGRLKNALRERFNDRKS